MQGRESSHRMRVLVVDQDDWSREFLYSVIKLVGFEECTLAASVAEALEALAKSTFDLVITDPKLPESPRLLDQVRSRDPHIRFILMVQQRTQNQHWNYLEQVDVVFKPPGLDEIIRKLRKAAQHKQRRQTEEEFRRLKQEAFRFL